MTIVPWQETLDGNFAKAFINACIPERKKLSRHLHLHQQPQSFESSDRHGSNVDIPFEIRQTVVDIVLAWAQDYAGGVSE